MFTSYHVFVVALVSTSYFSDLNTIENLWYILGKRIGKRRRECSNLKQLEAVIHEEWKNIGEDVCFKLATSMHERCFHVKKANGRHTKYNL
jgi:hypothetical protein